MSTPNNSAPPTVVVKKSGNWGTKILLLLITIALLALAGFLAVTFMPLWWAHRVGDVADGTFSSAVFAGLTCGFIFTALPLLMIRRVFALHGGISSRVVWLILAAVLASPNLTTLFIVLGSSNAAHDAERTLAVDAPGFRNASAAGAVVAAMVVLWLWTLLAGRRRRTKQLKAKDAELRRRDEELARLQATQTPKRPDPPA